MSDQGPKKEEYLFNGSKYATVEECVLAINAAKSNAHTKTAYWKLFKVKVVDTDNGGKAVKVECSLCGGVFSASNISRLAGKHFKDNFTSCIGSSENASTKRTPAAAEFIDDAATVGSSNLPASSSKRQKQDMRDYYVSEPMAVAAKDNLYLFFFSNPTVALHLIEDPHLVASYGNMGIKLPSRNTLAGSILDRVFREVYMEVVKGVFGPTTTAAGDLPSDVVDVYWVLDLPKLGRMFVIITDGWRNRAAAGGTPLVNILASGDTGRPAYLKVRTQLQQRQLRPGGGKAAGGWMSPDAQFPVVIIQQLMKAWAVQVCLAAPDISWLWWWTQTLLL